MRPPPYSSFIHSLRYHLTDVPPPPCRLPLNGSPKLSHVLKIQDLPTKKLLKTASSVTLSEILSRGTSWKNKLVNCGDKIQVGTVTVKPLYFIGLNDQCSVDDTAV